MKTKLSLLFLASLLMVLIISKSFSESKMTGCFCQCEPVLCRTERLQPEHYEIIYELQKHWKHLGVYKGEPNGIFDRSMEMAVCYFQKKHRLKVSGKIDQETWRTIGAVVPVKKVLNRVPPGNLEILVDLDALTLTILINRFPFRSFPVAIGKLDTPSPVGSWKVVSKGFWAKGGTKWLGLSVPFGVYGIHGTNQPWSIGRRASKGCIRMNNLQLEEVYRWVKLGTRVHIVGDPFRDRRILRKGLTGPDVYYLQIRLRQLGYLSRPPNGFYDYWTVEAVKNAQESLGLTVTGEVSLKEYYRLKLYWTD